MEYRDQGYSKSVPGESRTVEVVLRPKGVKLERGLRRSTTTRDVDCRSL